jgi:hypothetical protein
MRNFVLTLLALIMLTPSLACAAAYDMSLPAQTGQEPCHQSAEKQSNEGPVLVVDCLGVDLFQQQASEDSGPDLAFDIVNFDGFDFTITSLNTDYIHGIRGPPILQAEAVFHPLSIILTTQRFRL